MPRPKKYSRKTVLAAATKLFWKKGYDSTSLDELVQHTGLNRHSMYSEFGSKENLFLACIDHYVVEDNKEVINILTKKPLGLKNIEAFLENRLCYATSENCHGCLLVNTVIEKETVSDKINNKVNAILNSQENLIFLCLTAAKKRGEISEMNDCKSLTVYFSCFFRGLMNLGKNNVDKTSLNSLTEILISTIKK